MLDLGIRIVDGRWSVAAIPGENEIEWLVAAAFSGQQACQPLLQGCSPIRRRCGELGEQQERQVVVALTQFQVVSVVVLGHVFATFSSRALFSVNFPIIFPELLNVRFCLSRDDILL
jgi:hypothetical protein